MSCLGIWVHILPLSQKHCRSLICYQSSHKALCQSIVVHLIFLWGTRAWSFLVQLNADVTHRCFKVLISQRPNFFLVPRMFYCILLPIISYPQVSTELHCPCSSYMPATALHGFPCKLSCAALSRYEFPCKSAHRQGIATMFYLVLSGLREGTTSQATSSLLYNTAQGKDGVGVSKLLRDFLPFWTCLSLIVHRLDFVSHWLVSRTPTKLV